MPYQPSDTPRRLAVFGEAAPPLGDVATLCLGPVRALDLAPALPPWRIRGGALMLDRTRIMGIVNVTPDSFSDGGRFLDPRDALAQAERLLAEGADILDLGGESTRPGHAPVPWQDEWARLAPVLTELMRTCPVPVSVDTTKPEVAERALDLGVQIVNDVAGLAQGRALGTLAARAGAGYVGMVGGEPWPAGTDTVRRVGEELRAIADRAAEAGLAKDAVVLDPGFGFAVRGAANLTLLRRLDELALIGYPLLIGLSRKGFIGKALGGTPAPERLHGSVAGAVLAAWQGAAIVRVHDVAATRDALKLVDAVARA